MWELDWEESWALKNWCFWTVVLKTLASPLDYEEVQPIHPKGDQSLMFIGRTDAKPETQILWPPHAKSWLIGKNPYAGRDWGQEEKGITEDEMAGWHHWLNGHEFEWTPGVGDGQGGLACCYSWGRKELDRLSNWTELNWTENRHKCSLFSNRFRIFHVPPPIESQMNRKINLKHSFKIYRVSERNQWNMFFYFSYYNPIPLFLFQFSESLISLFIFILFYCMLLSKLLQIVLFSAAATAAKSLQSCLTLWDP